MPSAQAKRSTRPSDDSATAAESVRVLKKYPNRRLYDSQGSCYITLADVKQMVLDGEAFEVRDAKSGEDLTRAILLQIILEEESAGAPMFSTQSLAQIIRFYGHAMQGAMGSYLEQNLRAFADMQTRFMEQAQGLYDPKQFTPELWAQFAQGQAPLMQGLMANYAEQSKSWVAQMQEQMGPMGKQVGVLFPMPGFGSPQKSQK